MHRRNGEKSKWRYAKGYLFYDEIDRKLLYPPPCYDLDADERNSFRNLNSILGANVL